MAQAELRRPRHERTELDDCRVDFATHCYDRRLPSALGSDIMAEKELV